MEKKSAGKQSSFIKAVLITAIIAGTLDIIGAIISYTANGGKKPTVIFQYIASAVFGKSAFDGSVTMMSAGLLFHYLIAFLFTLGNSTSISTRRNKVNGNVSKTISAKTG